MTDIPMKHLVTTPANAGGNLAIAERTLGLDLRKLVQAYDKAIARHAAQIAKIHAMILDIGRTLIAAKALPGNHSTKRFGEWASRYGMATGAFRDQQERSAAMLIADLCDNGVAPHGLEEGLDGHPVEAEARLKLDLTNCRRTTPTNIMAWARRHQAELFPHLAAKREAARRALALKAPREGERSFPQDDDSPFASEADHTGADSGEASSKALEELQELVEAQRAEIAELEAEVAAYKDELAAFKDARSEVGTYYFTVDSDPGAIVGGMSRKEASKVVALYKAILAWSDATGTPLPSLRRRRTA